LTDFGVSLNLKMNSVEDGVVAGTPNWSELSIRKPLLIEPLTYSHHAVAPEIIELKGACFESDIWYELIQKNCSAKDY
jgi:hypothetical protein